MSKKDKTGSGIPKHNAAADDCPACFGNAKQCGKLPACQNCTYTQSCQYCAANPAPWRYDRDSKGHHVSIEHYQYAEEIAAEEVPLFDDPEPLVVDDDYSRPKYSNADLMHLLEFMLRGVDDYSLAIVECVLREEHTTASDVAKAFDVSREAMHRKLVDSCKRYPYLAEMLRCTLQRCKMLADPANRPNITGRRVRGVDKRGTGDEKTGTNKEQMELLF